MNTCYPPRPQPCALCHLSTDDAIVGNRLLSRWQVHRLPAEGTPAISWRCTQHQRYQMRPACAVWATEYGDLCFTLVCGHTSQWVLPGRWGYPPERVAQGLATGQIRLAQRQRCSACGDTDPHTPTDREPA